jgi:mRNA interferase MazF
LIDSKFSTVICAPIYSSYNELSTQVPVGVGDGLKHNSCIYCDEFISIPKSVLTNYIGLLSEDKMKKLDHTLNISLDIE